MDTLLSNSSYIFLFLSVLPCETKRGETFTIRHALWNEGSAPQLPEKLFDYSARYYAHFVLVSWEGTDIDYNLSKYKVERISFKKESWKNCSCLLSSIKWQTLTLFFYWNNVFKLIFKDIFQGKIIISIYYTFLAIIFIHDLCKQFSLSVGFTWSQRFSFQHLFCSHGCTHCNWSTFYYGCEFYTGLRFNILWYIGIM